MGKSERTISLLRGIRALPDGIAPASEDPLHAQGYHAPLVLPLRFSVCFNDRYFATFHSGRRRKRLLGGAPSPLLARPPPSASRRSLQGLPTLQRCRLDWD